MSKPNDLGRFKGAVVLRDGDDATVGDEPVFVLDGGADRRVLLVIDEHGKGVGLRVVEISADVLIVRFLFPVQNDGDILARVLLVQDEARVLVAFGEVLVGAGEAETDSVEHAIPEVRVAKCRRERSAEAHLPLFGHDELLPERRERSREHAAHRVRLLASETALGDTKRKRGLLAEKARKNLEVSPAFSTRKLCGYEFQERKLLLAQGGRRVLLVLLEKRRIGAELLNDDERIDCFVLVEVDKTGDAAEQLPEVLVFRLDEPHVGKAPLLERLEDPLLRYAVEGDRRATGDRRAAFLHHLAKRVLVVSAVARQRDGNEVVLLVVPDEV